MKTVSRSTCWPVLRSAALGLVLAISVLAGSAHADNGRGHDWSKQTQYNQRQIRNHAPADYGWNDHQRRANRYWGQSHMRRAPSTVYAPPLIYYPPRYEEPGINLIIPLYIN